MKKKTLIFGDREFVIAELNTAQVEELTTAKEPDGESDPNGWWRRRMWRTMLLSLNNASVAPTKENPLGSDTEPLSADDLKPTLGYSSAGDLHSAVLALSGLKSAAPGESRTAEEKPSTSTVSMAA